jgi:hypothetical protein
VKKQTIFDNEGNILYEGNSPTRKIFVRTLLKKGASFANANLSGYDLSRADLSGIDFTGANLDFADLRGSNADKSIFRGASMRGVYASGITAIQADFSEAKLAKYEKHGGKRSTFHHATLTYSKWDGANVEYTDFHGSTMSSASFVGATVRRTNFQECVLHNVDWVESSVISNNLTDADMTPTMSIADKHLPDRTYRATVYGNRYRNTEIGEGNAQFKYDKIWGKVSKYQIGTGAIIIGGVLIDALTSGGATGLTMAASAIGIGGESLLSNISGGAFVLGATMLAKSYIEDFLKDTYSGIQAKFNLQIRKAFDEALNRGKNLASLVGVLSTNETSRLIADYIKNADDTFFSKISATVQGELELIICDRKSLADALSRMSDAMVNRAPPDRKIVITRIEDHDDNGPKIFVLNTDGTTEAFWSHQDHGEAYVKWDKNGERISGEGNPRLACSESERNKAMDFFMRMIILDNNVPEFDFNSNTHAVRVGRDGSLVVTRRSDGRLSNPEGPVILTPNDEAIYPKPKHIDLSKIAENSYRKDNDDSIEDVNDNDNTPVEEVDEENYQSIMRM